MGKHACSISLSLSTSVSLLYVVLSSTFSLFRFSGLWSNRRRMRIGCCIAWVLCCSVHAVLSVLLTVVSNFGTVVHFWQTSFMSVVPSSVWLKSTLDGGDCLWWIMWLICLLPWPTPRCASNYWSVDLKRKTKRYIRPTSPIILSKLLHLVPIGFWTGSIL